MSESIFACAFRDIGSMYLGLTVDSCREVFMSGIPSGEHAVAGLDYSGSHCGRIVMVLDDNEAGRIADMIMSAFGISGLPAHAVFSELLNIYAGQIANLYARQGIDIDITPPLGCDEIIVADRAASAVELLTDRGLKFKFCFFEGGTND